MQLKLCRQYSGYGAYPGAHFKRGYWKGGSGGALGVAVADKVLILSLHTIR